MKAIIKYIKPYFGTKKKHPLKSTKEHELQQEYIILTYRSDIQKVLDTTYYDTDSGWGCMLRVGQMLIANLFYKKENRTRLQIVKLFYDNKPMPFSIQMFTEIAREICPGKKQYEWFSPSECGFIVKKLLDRFDQNYRVSICNDNCIFKSDIQADRQVLLVLVMARIGLDEPQPEYLKCVVQIMKSKYFFCLLGGTPKRAHLFMQYDRGYLGFLDPHHTQKMAPFEQLQKTQEEYKSTLYWIKEKQIDSSMAIAFHVPRYQLDDFWQSLAKIKQNLGEGFFIYMAQEKPQLGQNSQIVEIVDDSF